MRLSIPQDPKIVRSLSTFAQVAAGACVIAGGTVLLGLVLQLQFLTQPIIGHATTKANTALCLLLSGLALLLATRKVSWIRNADPWLRAAALFVITIAGLTVFEWVFYCNLGIDELFCKDIGDQQATRFPGRMGLNTAIAFVAFAIAIILAPLRGFASVLAHMLNTAVLAIATFCVLGYCFGVPYLYTIQSFTEMALLTGLGLLTLSLGYFAAFPDHGLTHILASKTPGGIAVRRYLPACILGVISLAWLRLKGQELGYYPMQFGMTILVFAMIVFLILLIWWLARILCREDEAVKLARALAESEAKYRSVVDTATDSIITINSQTKIIYFNLAAERCFGYKQAEIVGAGITRLFPSRFLNKGLEELINAKQVYEAETVELSALRKDGSEFPVELSLANWRAGDELCLTAFFHDITQRKNLEFELLRARDEALSCSRFKSDFLANMSHEIRTPMNGVMGMAEILLRSNISGRQLDYVRTIHDAGRSLLAVINDILDISKIEAGKLVLEFDEFEPVRLVESVADLLAAQARQKDLSLSTFIDPVIPLYLRSDAGRLRQILLNLASNSIKFSQSGEVILRAIREGRQGNFVTVKFSVTDTGVGMTDDEISNLFQPFVQLDAPLVRRQSGTGLGLNICKSLVELLGGKIDVHSVKGHGSTFSFTLELECAGKVQTRMDSADVKNVRILIVDDESSAREILHSYVISWGMQNGTAASAEGALTILRSAAQSDPYQVVLIDMCMPEMDGLQLGKVIREDENLSGTKMILITAFDKPGAGKEAISLGFDAYLTKPLKQSQLLDCVATVLNKNEKPREQEPSLTAGLERKKRSELILVAEDHPVNQQVTLLLLAELGFEAQIAQNGQEAVQLLQRVPYDLVFMDCQMPEMNGFDATRAIRKHESRTGKHIPIIAMTAHAIEGSRDQCMAAGMDDYISKPVDFLQLSLVLEKWLGVEERPEEPVSACHDSQNHPEDFQDLKTALGEKIAAELIAKFEMQMPIDLSLLKQALHEQNSTELREHAHMLKGAMLTLRAQRLLELLLALEQSLPTNDWSLIAQSLCKFENCVEVTLSNLRRKKM